MTSDGHVANYTASGYYQSSGASTDPTTGAWSSNGGAAPAGTVVLGACGGGGGGGGTDPFLSNATSTLEQSQSNIFYGFILFFITSFGIVGFFSTRFKKD